MKFGMNPSFHRWWGREIVFADAMKRASEFVRLDPQGQPTNELASVRLDRWPAERCSARLFGDMAGTIPEGDYVVTWEEGGDVSLRGSAVVKELSRSANRVVVQLKREGSVFAIFTPPVSRVRIWLPGMEATRPLFWPAYVQKARAMNNGAGPSTWRTLDWTRVNDYGKGVFVFDLAGVITPQSPSQGTKRGICPEYQAQFCNEVGADLHFQIPHRTAEINEADYLKFVTWQLQAIKRTLSPLRQVTIELSNEVWNEGFPQNRWFQSEAAARGLTLEQEIARQLALFWSYMARIFPTARRYVAGHTTAPPFMRKILEALPPGTRVDALGPACYFRPLKETIEGWMVGAEKGGDCPNCPTPLQIIEAARASFPKLRSGLREHRALADRFKARLELYEVGQSFIAGFQPWRQAAQQAQVLPELYHLYREAIAMLAEERVDLVNWYSFITEQRPTSEPSIGFGCWNDMDQTITLPVPVPYLDERAPKAAAIYQGPPA